MNKINTMSLRNHQGGFAGITKTLLIIVKISLVICALNLLFSIIGMIASNLEVKVMSASFMQEQVKSDIYTGSVKHIRETGIFCFKSRNVFDWLLLDRSFSLPFFNGLSTFLVVLFMYRILILINPEAPFSIKIARYIKWVGWLMIADSLFNGLRMFYSMQVIRTLTNGKYAFDFDSTGRYMFFAGIVVSIFAVVYRRGCTLQEEQDLTI